MHHGDGFCPLVNLIFEAMKLMLISMDFGTVVYAKDVGRNLFRISPPQSVLHMHFRLTSDLFLVQFSAVFGRGTPQSVERHMTTHQKNVA
jgi:hypothetical protein